MDICRASEIAQRASCARWSQHRRRVPLQRVLCTTWSHSQSHQSHNNHRHAQKQIGGSLVIRNVAVLEIRSRVHVVVVNMGLWCRRTVLHMVIHAIGAEGPTILLSRVERLGIRRFILWRPRHRVIVMRLTSFSWDLWSVLILAVWNQLSARGSRSFR